MKRTPALALAALAVAITFGAAACGDDSPDASSDTTEAPDTTEAAPDTTEAADTTEATETTEAGADTTEAPDETAAAPQPGDVPTIEAATPVLVGLTEQEAAAAAEALDWELRVTRIDGEDQVVTLDLRENRVNVAVVDGEVTEVLDIG
jgi:hypothetical protein